MDAVDRNLADVISISLGVQSVFGNVKQMHALGRAVDHAYERGVIIVGAAGQTEDAPQLVGFTVYPGRYSRTILVGGINADMKVCFDYENGRQFVDVWAPADDIRRPNSVFGMPEPFKELRGNGDGTSYATVHVAGAAAMWLRKRGARARRRTAISAGSASRRSARCCARHSGARRQRRADAARARPIPASSIASRCSRTNCRRSPDLKKAQLAEPEID